MLLVTDLNDLPVLDTPCGLTIGSFDGVHLGHQALLKSLRAKIPAGGNLVVFTFSNHPSHHFSPDNVTPLIYPPLQKVHYLKQLGADLVVLVPFNKEFSQTPFDAFLGGLHRRLKLKFITLGVGATFGKGKQGNEETIKKIAAEWGFEAEYMPKFMVDNAPVSSGRIRKLISQGELHDAAACLGRPYSLMGHCVDKAEKWGIDVQGLCLPPAGTWPVTIKEHHHIFPARAHVSPGEQKIYLEPLKESFTFQRKEIEIIF